MLISTTPKARKAGKEVFQSLDWVDVDFDMFGWIMAGVGGVVSIPRLG